MTHSIPVFLPPDVVMFRFCARAGADLDALRGTATTRDITRLRHEAMWLLRNLTTATLDQIGAMLDRSGAAANEGIDKIARRIEVDPDYRARMVALMGVVTAGDLPIRPSDPATREVDLHRLMAASILADQRLSDGDAKQAAHAILTVGMELHAPKPEFPKGL